MDTKSKKSDFIYRKGVKVAAAVTAVIMLLLSSLSAVALAYSCVALSLPKAERYSQSAAFNVFTQILVDSSGDIDFAVDKNEQALSDITESAVQSRERLFEIFEHFPEDLKDVDVSVFNGSTNHSDIFNAVYEYLSDSSVPLTDMTEAEVDKSPVTVPAQVSVPDASEAVTDDTVSTTVTGEAEETSVVATSPGASGEAEAETADASDVHTEPSAEATTSVKLDTSIDGLSDAVARELEALYSATGSGEYSDYLNSEYDTILAVSRFQRDMAFDIGYLCGGYPIYNIKFFYCNTEKNIVVTNCNFTEIANAKTAAITDNAKLSDAVKVNSGEALAYETDKEHIGYIQGIGRRLAEYSAGKTGDQFWGVSCTDGETQLSTAAIPETLPVKLLRSMNVLPGSNMTDIFDRQYDNSESFYAYINGITSSTPDYLSFTYSGFNTLRDSFKLILTAFITSILLFIALLIFLLAVCARKNAEEAYVVTVEKTYNDWHFLISGGVLTALVSAVCFAVVEYLRSENFSSVSFWGAFCLLSVLIFGIGVTVFEYIISFARNLKTHTLIRHSFWFVIIAKISGLIKKISSVKLKEVKKQYIAYAVGYIGVNAVLTLFILISSAAESFGVAFFFMLVSAAFNVSALVLILNILSSLNKIATAAENISRGKLDEYIDIASVHKSLKPMAISIMTAQQGIKNAVDEAMKGERMKTELITNVSHDLKTPLTSIVSYVDLLKKCDISDMNAKRYIDVIDEKSDRLKVLIEDLVEASKASSGNVKLNLMSVNLNELLAQVVGENSDKLEENGIDVVMAERGRQCIVTADSVRTWRVMENLFSNIRKYAMPGTRVYADVDIYGNYGRVRIKNVSKNELNISPEKLMERFVRGDESRTGEGSGLGLSIAKSLTELQNGRFGIEIDGDLFKVTVLLPLAVNTATPVEASPETAPEMYSGMPAANRDNGEAPQTEPEYSDE